MADFVHLHVHSEFSLLDGLSKIPQLVAKAKASGMKSLALTDHGVMYGVHQFYIECRNQGIKPLIGCELYVATRSRFDKEVGKDQDRNHLLVIAKNNQGYKNLMQLVTKAHLEGFYYRPRIDMELLEELREGLVVTSGCLQGQIPQMLMQGETEKAEKQVKRYLELFGDDFYFEIQNHENNQDQDKLNGLIIEFSRKFGVPLVATNDVHYVEKEDADAQDALLAVQTKRMLSDKDRLTMISSPSYYLRTPQEMSSLFAQHPEALQNTLALAEKCDVTIKTGKWILPDFPLPKGESAEDHLRKLTWERLDDRYEKPSPELKDRIAYELQVICDKGFATYFLIFQDFVNWAKQQGIRVGPGRGSAAGSLVSYVLRITSIDPIQHGLPFERFLNPDRPTPPDIDLDFADDRRDEVIDYVSKKYGDDKVAHIITFGTMEARGSVRDIGRVLGMPYSEPDKIAKLIPLGYSIEESLSSVFELQELYAEPKYKKLLDLAKKVEGNARHASVHAAGIVIADRQLTEYTPLQREAKRGHVITQYDMYALDCNINDDAIGLLKMDFLGLRNLTILQKAIDFVEQETGQRVDVSSIPLDDPKVYELLGKGETTGVFQLESAGMRRVARSLKPSRFSDIMAMVALYRPGPMDLINDFIKGKANPSSVKYPHSDLRPVLEETYGIAVYQEQCLQIANVMAGYSMGEADILRRAIGKKKRSIMEKEKKKFIKGAKDKGYTKQTAETVWGYIEKFAGYGFNKAHSASYAMIAYQTGYMKANYPVEFMAALLTAESHNKDKIAIAVEECDRMGIQVQRPDVNKSAVGFTIEKAKGSLEGKAIRFGLSAIKNVGEAAIEATLAARDKEGDFRSLTDFCSRVDGQKVNKKVLESLIQVGALDQFGKRAAMLTGLESVRQKTTKLAAQKASGQTSLFEGLDNPGGEQATTPADDLPDVAELEHRELLDMEKSLLGFYLTENPWKEVLSQVEQLITHKLFEIDPTIHTGQIVTVAGVIGQLRKVFTKRNNAEMAFATLEDDTGSVDLVIFPKIYETLKAQLNADVPVLVKGKVDFREEKLSLVAEEIAVIVAGQKPSGFEEQKKMVEVTIPRGASRRVLSRLQEIFTRNPGETEVVLILPNGANGDKRLSLPYPVAYTPKLQEEIEALFAGS
jgi:DNA polymerase-3 subunit alpha